MTSTVATHDSNAPLQVYVPKRHADSAFVVLRGWQYHVLTWGDPMLVTPERPPLLMLHGWMDVAASFQFVVDAFAQERYVVALDWRGFGQTTGPAVDHYWFPDYLADLDAYLDDAFPNISIDLLGHSMGGNVAMLYAGARPGRVRRLVNLEGFGISPSDPDDAPKQMSRWLDQLKKPVGFKDYEDLAGVATRMRMNNPRLRKDLSLWLAAHWARQGADGRWTLTSDPVHKRMGPLLGRREESVAFWSRIEAPMLWVEGSDDSLTLFWRNTYPREDFESRLAVVPKLTKLRLNDAGHMVHHDQPVEVARAIEGFLGA
jgi:pimeloyl-ACP methyl ester carboxylesterase